ncbi:MAG: radical SAM protein [Clostridia bacterium]|nr:radical SAM protein [Clostridia bacterium]
MSGSDQPTFPLAFCDRLRMATDGAGVTALVGAFGCPLQCKLCINPQTWHERKDGKPPFERVTPAELFERVKIDSLYYLATGGGVTFGGGEPLLHTDFITAFREVCHPDWRIYAESCLNIPQENVRAAAAVVDHFFIDIKDMNPAVYKAYTGKDNALVKSNLTLLLSLVGAERVTVRVPRIPGFNTDTHVQSSAAELMGMGVELLDIFDYKIPDPKKLSTVIPR